MTRDFIRFWRRGRLVELKGFDPATTLIDYLRLQERSTGTKEGCAEGDCGACTVAIGRLVGDKIVYEPVNSCISLLGQVDGTHVVTVEDIGTSESLHPVQKAMVQSHGSQCGFCTPGIVMSLFTLYHEASRPVLRQNVCDALAGNLCRCTGYRPIVEAALSACAAEPQDRFAAGKVEAAQILRQLWDDADIFLGDEKSFFASPASEGALATLLLAHPDAVIVAGATDVGLWITKALRTLKKIVWLGRVQGLDRIENLADTVTFGAAASHAQALDVLFEIDRDLGAVMRRFGAPQVRAKGTVGGNIANGSPIGDLAPAFIALGASLELRRGDERRSLSLEDFFIAYGKQDRRQGEYLRSVTVPRLKAGEVFRAHKISKRFDEDISAVMGAFRLLLDGRHIVEATVAFGGMAGTPKRAFVVETALKGCSLDQPVSWRAAQDAIAQDFTPLSDHRASASYRSRVAANLVRRTLEEVARGANDQTRIFDLQTAE